MFIFTLHPAGRAATPRPGGKRRLRTPAAHHLRSTEAWTTPEGAAPI